MDPKKKELIAEWFNKDTKLNVKMMREILGPKYTRTKDVSLKKMRERLYRIADLVIEHYQSERAGRQ